MSTGEAGRPATSYGLTEPTLTSSWHAAGSPITDELLDWPPDVFALTNVILGRSEGFRCALSPVGVWPPSRYPNWSDAVGAAARRHSAWVEDRRGALPDVLVEERRAFRERDEMPLEQLAQRGDSTMCEALIPPRTPFNPAEPVKNEVEARLVINPKEDART